MNRLELYSLTQELLKHKDELLKTPDTFKVVLESLKKDAEDDNKGYSVVDDPNQGFEEDDADKWLKDKEAAAKENAAAPEEQEKPDKYMKPWEPRGDYTDKEAAAITNLVKQGYSHREAERLAGAHKSTLDFRSALKSGVAPNMISDKMMGDLKPLAKEWLDQADRREKLSADPSINPMKHASGKMMAAHEKNTGDFNKAYGDFLNSEGVKNLKGKDRHQAVQQWKSSWKKDNPGFNEGLSEASQAQKTFGESKQAAKESLEDKMRHIMGGGQSMPTDMSAQEAMQHLGGGKTESGYQGTISQDPSASFAAKNPQLLAAMKPEQQDRLKRIDSAAKSQGVIRRPKKIE